MYNKQIGTATTVKTILAAKPGGGKPSWRRTELTAYSWNEGRD